MTQRFFPAIRSRLGDWNYYLTTMSLQDVADRISFARDIHKHEGLSSFIQRRLEKGRPEQIASYLCDQDERFFNALVVATYRGNPLWYDLGRLTSADPKFDVGQVDQEVVDQLGFLSLSGEERLFAVDGQHRLAGIKQALRDESAPPELAAEHVGIVMVGHDDTPAGLRRTRRLFTTLNKTARPVLKGDIIALDEDDIMAICTRRLIEETPMFGGNTVAIRLMPNLAPDDLDSWTTIVVLYDLLSILFSQLTGMLVPELTQRRMAELKRIRPPDGALDRYFSLAVESFTQLRSAFPELDKYFRARGGARRSVVRRYRNSDGGSMIFRPIGQKIMFQVIAALCKHGHSFDHALGYCAELPRTLAEVPYAFLIWHPGEGRMITTAKNSALVRDILLYQLDEPVRGGEDALLGRYQRALDDEGAELPERILFAVTN